MVNGSLNLLILRLDEPELRIIMVFTFYTVLGASYNEYITKKYVTTFVIRFVLS